MINTKLTTTQTANLFCVSPQTIINWCVTRKLGFTRIGKGPRKISKHDIENFINANKVPIEALDQEMASLVLGQL